MGRLILTRKPGEDVKVDQGRIVVRVLEVRGRTVRLAFEAPPEIAIARGEVCHRAALPDN